MTLDQVKTREQAIDVLEGCSEEQPQDCESRSRRPLVKSYMFETVPPGCKQPAMESMFAKVQHRLIPLDDTMHRVYDEVQQKTVGLLEQIMPRHPVLYTVEHSRDMDRFAKCIVRANAALDSLWISGRAFSELFAIILRTTPKHRFGRLVFQHNSIFEPDGLGQPFLQGGEDCQSGEEADIEDAEEMEDAADEIDETYVPERRATKFTMVDRLEVLESKLPQMRGIYDPLCSISQLRFPARTRGGHDFYYHGKVTNHSTSFADHRQHIDYVLRIYNRATVAAERTAWQSIERTAIGGGADAQVLTGAPVLLRFKEKLPQGVFDAFIDSTFRRKRSKFRLWGNPIQLGPRKVHVYGVDRHIWQPIFLEITDSMIIAVIPHGTCGNSIHRLVTNVQQYLDPAVDVWIGDTKYDDLIDSEPASGYQ